MILLVALAVTLAAGALAPSQAAPPEQAHSPLAPGARRIIDDFEDASAWSAHPSDGVKLAISSDAGVHGRALRLDFAFSGGGYAVARRAVALDLPENYRLRFAVRGECLPNDLELKLIDASGENVWWCNRRAFRFPAAWDSLSTRKRQITFAWGPLGGGEIRRVAAIEIAVTAGSGGTGTVWLDDFTLEALPPANTRPPAPRASASSAQTGHAPSRALDGARSSAWRSAAGDSLPWLALDLVAEREFGGLVVDWGEGRFAPDYVVEASSDGNAWRALREVRGGDGGRDYLRLPEAEARHVRVRATRAQRRGCAIRELAVKPLAFGETMETFYAAIAKDAPRGTYPRGISGEASAWAVVGVDGGRDEGMLSTDGSLETGKRQFSIEPFVRVRGKLYTWADARLSRALAEGALPIPSVTWRLDSLELTVTAFAIDGMAAPLAESAGYRPALVARYRVRNPARRPIAATLYLALRPFQVNPPVQFLNTPGGSAPVRSLVRSGAVVRVNDDRGVLSLTPPTAFGAASFDGGDIVEHLRTGTLPAADAVQDPFEHASGALAYALEIPAGGERVVDLLVPFAGVPVAAEGAISSADLAAAEGRVAAGWREKQLRPAIDLPDRDVVRTVKAQLGWILINRDSAGIQPGSRSYERSWIRDGALTSTALLRLGQREPVREFMEWFAGYQYPDGKVPCCVDARGADPVPEHDSHGEFIHLVSEYFRYTGDRATVERLWPAVARAAAYIDTLRAQRRTAEWRVPGKEEFYGLLPPSISHEGYSAKPMHSYWDDFFALRGLKDAATLARLLGHAEAAARIGASRDQFMGDLRASIAAAMKRHGIDYVPGCADLGDFDATSTTIALDPAAAEHLLPLGALQRTFERYWDFFRDRRDGEWENYTPYEVRVIGAFVRLGWRERAHELMEYFLAHRSPPEWAQWAEVVWRDPKTPRFIGDLPHTWVGSDFVRSALDLLVYENEASEALVLGAGVSWDWASRGDGVRVEGLPTPYGPLSYTLKARGDSVEVRIEEGLRVPPGGILVLAPHAPGRPPRKVTVNDVAAAAGREGAPLVRELPAVVILRP